MKECGWCRPNKYHKRTSCCVSRMTMTGRSHLAGYDSVPDLIQKIFIMPSKKKMTRTHRHALVCPSGPFVQALTDSLMLPCDATDIV